MSDDGKIRKTLPGLRIRTSPFLVMYFRDEELTIENYMTRQSFQASESTVKLLSHFARWRTVSQTSKALPEYTRQSIVDSILNLLESGLLITEGSAQDLLSRKFNEDWLWPVPSRYYHFSTKMDEPYSTSEEIKEYYERYLKGKIQPAIYKTYSGRRRIQLLSATGTDSPLFKTLHNRVSSREFSGGPISFRELSTIARYTWGRVSTYNTREFGRLLHKTSPSAGARHPIECYAVVNNVEHVNPGIYHYSVRDHSLELLRPGDFKDKCVEFSAGQLWTRNASVLFIMTAMVARTAWKYRIPRVYRAFLLDAGHLSQTFLLASTSLGLGAFCIGIISDLAIERELGLDGINETALFAVGVGQIVRNKTVTGSNS